MLIHPAARQQGFKENVDGMPNTPQNYELVYAIQSKNLKYVKIGFTTDVNQRLSSLQGGSPDELQVIGCWFGSVNDERRLHEELRKWRIHREWFQPADEVMQVISRRNMSVKCESEGKLKLACKNGAEIEIWETCRDSKKENYRPRPSIAALIDLIAKASQLSEALPPHHGQTADQIVADARAAFDALTASPDATFLPKKQVSKQAAQECSFCGAPQKSVIKLIAGPDCYICDACVDICNEILLQGEPAKRRAYCIQSSRDYIYSAESKRDALRMWLREYWPQGEDVSNLSIRPLADDGVMNFYPDSDKTKEPITKTYKEWALGQAGFLGVYLEKQEFDMPSLKQANDDLAKAKSEIEALKLKLSNATTEVFHVRASAEALSKEVQRLSAPRPLTLRERVTGTTEAQC